MLETIFSFNEFDTNENFWFYYVELTIGILSMIGSAFVIIAFLFYKTLRNHALELVFYMMIASFLNNLSYLINYIEADNKIIQDMKLCRTQAFLMIWSEISQMTWATLIAYSVYEKVVNFDESAESNQSTCYHRLKYLLIGFVWPLIMPFIGYEFDLLGPSGKWCWIYLVTQNPIDIIYGWVIYLIVWAFIFSKILFTCVIIRFLHKTYSREKQIIVTKFIKKLISYPIIQIICWLPTTINRLFFTIYGSYNLWLQLFAIIFLGGQGFAYAIAYGFNPQVRSALYLTFCRRRRQNINYVADGRISNDSFISSGSERDRMQERIVDFSL